MAKTSLYFWLKKKLIEASPDAARILRSKNIPNATPKQIDAARGHPVTQMTKTKAEGVAKQRPPRKRPKKPVGPPPPTHPVPALRRLAGTGVAKIPPGTALVPAQARTLAEIRKALPKKNRLGAVKDWWKGKTRQEKNTFMRRVGYTGGAGGLAIWLASNAEVPKTTASDRKKTDAAKKETAKIKRPGGQLPPSVRERETSRISREGGQPPPSVRERGRQPSGRKLSSKVAKEKEPGFMPWNWIKKSGPPKEAGEYAPGIRVYKTPWGDLTVDSSPEAFDFDPDNVITDKKGGQVGRSMKKAKPKGRSAPKTRKRAALRGHRAELRGG